MERGEAIVTMEGKSLNGFETNCLFENGLVGSRDAARGADAKGAVARGVPSFDNVAYHEGADQNQDGRALIQFDMDNDGDVDFFVTNYCRRGNLLRNDTPIVARGGNHRLSVKLVGTKSNRDAVGARLEVTAGGMRQVREVRAGEAFLSGQTLVQHVGLGRATRIDLVRVRWPSGAVQEWRDVPADLRLRIVEGDDAYQVLR